MRSDANICSNECLRRLNDEFSQISRRILDAQIHDVLGDNERTTDDTCEEETSPNEDVCESMFV